MLYAGSAVKSADEEHFLRLDALVKSHDVCYVLTDSREARWLPTVMCAAHDKLLINAALGFDSYLVMQHGRGGNRVTPPSPTSSSPPPLPPPPAAAAAASSSATSMPGTNESLSSTFAAAAAPAGSDNSGGGCGGIGGGVRLGCYFCNDVVAATNSQRDRSMDQMCTVTRPGLSFIAAAQAVELMVALLMKTQRTGSSGSNSRGSSGGGRNPGDGIKQSHDDSDEIDDSNDDGAVPHQIRGSLAGFTQMSLMTPAFSCCTACSPAVVAEFQRRGFDFLRQVCESPSVLEEISGVQRLNDLVDLELCIESDDEF